MVDALREARRVLTRRGVLIDVRPVVAPIVVEVVIDAQAIWAVEVASFSAPEDTVAADAAVQQALSSGWFGFEKSIAFDFEIFCDTAAELRAYANARKLRGAEIPYVELEARQRAMRGEGQALRLRCRRLWMLSTYGKDRF
ncbi:MAG TPA: hypothetical protein VKU19_21680 [Bryobacteraceae bacterium]|nr:hypothetical protein [Bryobacteraceae bacterium]